MSPQRAWVPPLNPRHGCFARGDGVGGRCVGSEGNMGAPELTDLGCARSPELLPSAFGNRELMRTHQTGGAVRTPPDVLGGSPARASTRPRTKRSSRGSKCCLGEGRPPPLPGASRQRSGSFAREPWPRKRAGSGRPAARSRRVVLARQRRTMESRLGKTPTTWVRRRISLLRRSWGLLDRIATYLLGPSVACGRRERLLSPPHARARAQSATLRR